MSIKHTSDLLLAVALTAMVSGCAFTPRGGEVPPFDPTLIDGTAVFGEEVSASESPDHDLLGVTPEMLEFVENASQGKLIVSRYKRLISKLRKHGYFTDVYDAAITSTAANTFENKVGNCISYTNMFVALARAADIRVHYQLVERRFPTWNVDGGLLVRNNHVNVYVEARYRDYDEGYTVDFNQIDPEPDAVARTISDAHAASLFYANLSVEELVKNNDRLAFSYLRKALEMAPENTDLWINLGAFYGRYGKHEKALEAYDVARVINPGEKTVLSGIERSLRAIGRIEEADRLERKVRRYRNSNPFYHFAIAQIAYEEGNFPESLEAVDRAIDMRKRNPRFHFLKGLNLYQLGDKEGARNNFDKARRFGRFDDLWERYTRDMPEPDLAASS